MGLSVLAGLEIFTPCDFVFSRNHGVIPDLRANKLVHNSKNSKESEVYKYFPK